MKLTIEIPITFDGISELPFGVVGLFKTAVKEYAEAVVKERFEKGARMYGTTCRFAFNDAKISVDEIQEGK